MDDFRLSLWKSIPEILFVVLPGMMDGWRTWPLVRQLSDWYHPQYSNLGPAYWNVSAEKPIGSFQLINSIRWWNSICYFNRCIDHFLLPKSCVSLTFSASGSFLATAHVDDLGVYLWNNQSLYTQISLRSLGEDFEPKTAPLPGSSVKGSEPEIEESEQIEDEEEFSSPEQIADSLVTLSLLPDSRWKNLLSLDAIKVS